MTAKSPLVCINSMQYQPDTVNNIPRLGFELPNMYDHVLIEVLRVNAQQKFNKIKDIFSMNNEALKQFFQKYQPYDQLKLRIHELKQTQTGKILKKKNSIYYGEVNQNIMEGKGVLFHQEGRIYEGWFQNNQKVKEGYQIYSSGNLYIGQFERNQKHGNGIYFWYEASMKIIEGCCNTQFYKGDWWGGMPSGNGIHHKISGNIYEGEFKNGLKHGNGIEKFPDGDFYRGNYVNGLPEGYGQYKWKDLSIYKGDFKHGLRHGFGVWKQKQNGEGQKYQGHYLFDYKSGYGVYVWGKTLYYKGQFLEDKRHGFGQLFQNGKIIYSGAWEKGEQNPNFKPKPKSRVINKYQTKNVQNIKSITQKDETLSSKRQFSAIKKNAFNESIDSTRSPKFKITLKKNSLSRSSLNPQAARMQVQNPYYRSSHKNCIPIDEYLSMNKRLTRR